MKMGDGKTVIAATAISSLGVPALVVGTKRIVEDVWPAELLKWEHLSSLSYSAASGPKKKREAAVASNPDILGVSYENLQWYLETCDSPRPIVFFDEITKMKSHSTNRFKALKKYRGFERAYGLTATPSVEGHVGLWAQWRTVGGDDRLGRTVTEFRQLFTTPVFKGMFTDYIIPPGKARAIEKLLAPDVFTIPASERPYLGAPTVLDIPVGWSSKAARDLYLTMEREMVAVFENGDKMAAASRGVAKNKCRQIATGFMYGEDREVYRLDDEKIRAVVEAVEELQGEPCLVFYDFIEEKEQLLAALPGAKSLEGDNYREFNAGRIPVLVLHPKSCSHGLNLQNSQYAFFSSVPWSGEQYAQAVGRIDRQGQTRQPVVKRFLRAGTVDEEIAAIVDGKIKGDAEMVARIRERWE